MEQKHKTDLDSLHQRIIATVNKRDATVRQLKEDLAEKSSQLEEAQLRLQRQREELLAHLS